MTALHYTVRIAGETYTDRQLQRLEYERTLHALHELKRLGADIGLTHTELNWLEPEYAKSLLLKVKLDLTPQGIETLLKDVLADSDKRWKEWAKEPIEKQGVRFGVTEFEFFNIGLAEFQKMMHSTDLAWGLGIMPEHYHFEGAVSSGTQRIVETLGAFGEPTDTVGKMSIPDYLNFERDKNYPQGFGGAIFLSSDDTPMYVGAIHEFCPTSETSFRQKSTFFCPNNAPKAIADGHTLHFAIEIVNGMKVAFEKLAK